MRRLLWGAALAVTAVFAVAGLVTAATPRAEVSLAEQTRAVAQTLRCPTCLGEDVADSAAPLAESMRLVVAEQLAAGASPAQVRAWFAQRYGDEVLLDPPARGTGWLLWLVPLALLAVASLALARRGGPSHRAAAGLFAVLLAGGTLAVAVGPLRGEAALRGEAGLPGEASLRETASAREVLDVLDEAVARRPGDARLRVLLAEELWLAGNHEAAVEQHAAAARLAPFDPDVGFGYAAALLRTGQRDDAIEVLRATVTMGGGHGPSAAVLEQLGVGAP